MINHKEGVNGEEETDGEEEEKDREAQEETVSRRQEFVQRASTPRPFVFSGVFFLEVRATV